MWLCATAPRAGDRALDSQCVSETDAALGLRCVGRCSRVQQSVCE